MNGHFHIKSPQPTKAGGHDSTLLWPCFYSKRIISSYV